MQGYKIQLARLVMKIVMKERVENKMKSKPQGASRAQRASTWPNIDKQGKHAPSSPIKPPQSGRRAPITSKTLSGPHWQRDMPPPHRARMP